MEKIELEQALELVLSHTLPVTDAVSVPLQDALGLCAAETVAAPLDNPPFDRSPLDGFAIRSADTRNASAENEVKFRIVDECAAGIPAVRPVLAGEAVRIMTGGMMPVGSDCVVAKENAREDGGFVFVHRRLDAHQNYVFRGEDIQKGQTLISKGERLNAVRLAVLAGMGFERVSVVRPPRIGLLCTGDELVSAGTPLLPGKIYNSNFTLFAMRLRELGFSAIALPDVPDDAEKTVALIKAAFTDGLDLLITTGAVSVGDKDIFHEVFRRLDAERLFWRMNHKPGGNVLCGEYHGEYRSDTRGKLLICLSGNPFAAFTGFELLAKPVLAKLAGRLDLETQRRRATLETAFSKSGGTRRFIRACYHDGTVIFPDGQHPGQLFSLVDCNCLIDIPADSGALAAGDEVEIVVL
jgi:molybdopterin molybdotransferase